MSEKFEKQTVDYLYHELPANKRKAFEKLLDKRPELRYEVELLKDSLTQARQLEQEKPLPTLGTHVLASIMEEAKKEAHSFREKLYGTHAQQRDVEREYLWHFPWKSLLFGHPAVSFAVSLLIVGGLAFWGGQEFGTRRQLAGLDTQIKNLALRDSGMMPRVAKASESLQPPSFNLGSLAPNEDSPETRNEGNLAKAAAPQVPQNNRNAEFQGTIETVAEVKDQNAPVRTSQDEFSGPTKAASEALASSPATLNPKIVAAGAPAKRTLVATADTATLREKKRSDKALSPGAPAAPAAIDRYFELANENRVQRNWPEAIKNYEEVAKIDPSSDQSMLAYHYIARTYAESGDYQRSLKQYELILHRYPAYDHRGEIYFEIGQIYMAQEKPDKASQYLQHAYINYPFLRRQIIPYLEKNNEALRGAEGQAGDENNAPLQQPAPSIRVNDQPAQQ